MQLEYRSSVPLSAVYRAAIADFIVVEVLGFDLFIRLSIEEIA
jgi:hypothetical protein